MKSAWLDDSTETWVFWLDRPNNPFNLIDGFVADLLYQTVQRMNQEKPLGVLIRSGKALNFANGAQLLLSSLAVDTLESLKSTTQSIRQAYQALRASDVPSVLLLEGVCFGCAAELSAHCHYRVGLNSLDAHFYMTEVADYRFGTAFEGSVLFPRIMGFEAAAEFVLWGKRFFGQEAVRVGLLDESASTSLELLEHAKRLLEQRPPRRGDSSSWEPSDDEVLIEHTSRIRALPKTHQLPYQSTLDVLVAGAKASSSDPIPYALELEACVRTVARHEAKAAIGLFNATATPVMSHGFPDERTPLELCFGVGQTAQRLYQSFLKASLLDVTLSIRESFEDSIFLGGQELQVASWHLDTPARLSSADVVLYPHVDFAEVSMRTQNWKTLGKLFYRLVWPAIFRKSDILTPVGVRFCVAEIACAHKGASRLHDALRAMGVRSPCSWRFHMPTNQALDSLSHAFALPTQEILTLWTSDLWEGGMKPEPSAEVLWHTVMTSCARQSQGDLTYPSACSLVIHGLLRCGSAPSTMG